MPSPRTETDPLHVLTVKPEKESSDWDPLAKAQRRWNVKGIVVQRSDSHGLIYQVQHEDGLLAWYEPRELVSRTAETEGIWSLLL